MKSTELIFTVNDLQSYIESPKITIIGDINRVIHNLCPIEDGNIEGLSFCNIKGNNALPIIERSKAGVILCWDDTPHSNWENKTLVHVENPRLWYIRCAKHFFPRVKKPNIHPTVIIGENCEIETNVHIGPYTTIDDNVKIQSRSIIGSHVHISDAVQIGKNVIIKSGCVIGSDGFGYEKNELGEFEKFPHYGSVLIEDNVEIGANTCIDRGTLSNTIIGKGTKIDNLVHIAHNVVIGRNCAIVCLSCIAGSVKLGDGVWIAPLSVIRDGIQIGEGSTVGMGAVVTRDVEPHDIVAGVPAKSIKKG